MIGLIWFKIKLSLSLVVVSIVFAIYPRYLVFWVIKFCRSLFSILWFVSFVCQLPLVVSSRLDLTKKRRSAIFFLLFLFVVDRKLIDFHNFFFIFFSAYLYLFIGCKNRQVRSHSMNENSSRSHSVMTINLFSEIADPDDPQV